MTAVVRRAFVASLALGLAVLLVRGLSLITYAPVTTDAYVWGAFHVHSTLSDGLLPVEEIAREAKAARVGFVMLSDHGPPHPEAMSLKRTIDGVRFIGGSEVGIPDGHLIVSDVRELPLYTLPPFPPDALSDVATWGGISVVTYPEDPVHRWSYWEEDLAPDGIEIVNVTSYFRRSSLLQKLSWAFFSVFNRNYYISGFEAPTEALERWDELLSRRPVNGFYAVNAHGGFPLTETRTIGIPSYRTAMSYVGLAVDPRYREAPEDAIRRGEFFSAREGRGRAGALRDGGARRRPRREPRDRHERRAHRPQARRHGRELDEREGAAPALARRRGSTAWRSTSRTIRSSQATFPGSSRIPSSSAPRALPCPARRLPATRSTPSRSTISASKRTTSRRPRSSTGAPEL